MSEKKLGWILTLSLPGILSIRFLTTFILTLISYVGGSNVELLDFIKSMINYGLSVCFILSVIATPIGIFILVTTKHPKKTPTEL